jgi:hypothetical protein
MWLSGKSRSGAFCCERTPTSRGAGERLSACAPSSGARRQSARPATGSRVFGSQAELLTRQPPI